jgi:protein TonB
LRDTGENVSYEARALRISFAVHISAIMLFVAANHFFAPERELPVIDFTIVNLVQPAGKGRTPAGPDRTQPREKRKGKYPLENPQNLYSHSETKSVKLKRDTPKPHQEEPLSKDYDIRQLPDFPVPEPEVELQFPAVSGIYHGSEAERNSNVSGASGEKNAPPAGGPVQQASLGGLRGFGADRKATYLKAHFSYIRDMVNSKLTYPVIARQMGWEGKVKVSFTISRDGFATDIMITQSSGKEVLDNSAVEAVRNASPFPRPPVSAQIIIPIRYRLR